MDFAKFNCQLITPAFMYGTNSNFPELRPSEFKGMMRFWWRAIKANNNIDSLKKEEAKLFGGTGKGEGKSKFIIRLSYDHKKLKSFISSDLRRTYNLKWSFNKYKRSLVGTNSGIGYLFFSVYRDFFIRDDFNLTVKLSTLDMKNKRSVLASFWLSVFLGGFGSRSRRGGCNISITKVENVSSDIDFLPKAKTKEELGKWLNKNIEIIRNILNASNSGNKAKYPNLNNAKIVILDPKTSWIDSFTEMGNRYLKYRLENRRKLWSMASFGMPVIHNRPKTRMVPYDERGRISDKMASPLIFKTIKSGNCFFPVVIQLNTNMPKIGKELKSTRWSPSKENDIKFPEKNFDQFLDSLGNQTEVLNL